MSDTWTPEQMCQRATALVESGCYCGEAQCYACITANMLRQGAADRERVTALIAAMASDEGDAQAVLRLAIELASVEGPLSPSIRRLLKHCANQGERVMQLQERVTALEANLATVDTLRQAAEAWWNWQDR